MAGRSLPVRVGLALLLVLSLAPSVAARATREQARIEYLIASVARLEHAVFIRNGEEYSAARAAAHLRRKLHHAGEQVQTAEQFIACCASASSLSKRSYLIRFSDGRVLESARFLLGKLREFDARRLDSRQSPSAVGATIGAPLPLLE